MRISDWSSDVCSSDLDSLGRFYFDLGEKYGKRLNLHLQTSTPSEKKLDYIITLDKNKPLPISIDIPSPKTRTDTIVQTIVEGSIARQSAEAAYRLSSGTTLLEQVTVEDSRMTPERKKVIETYGEPDAIISGDSIQEKEEQRTYGLYSEIGKETGREREW